MLELVFPCLCEDGSSMHSWTSFSGELGRSRVWFMCWQPSLLKEKGKPALEMAPTSQEPSPLTSGLGFVHVPEPRVSDLIAALVPKLNASGHQATSSFSGSDTIWSSPRSSGIHVLIMATCSRALSSPFGKTKRTYKLIYQLMFRWLCQQRQCSLTGEVSSDEVLAWPPPLCGISSVSAQPSLTTLPLPLTHWLCVYSFLPWD